jgi:phosphate transport system substrate-binding protein
VNRMLGRTRSKRAMVLASALGLALSSAVMAAAGGSASAAVKVPASGVETPPTASLIETGSTLLYPLFNLWVPGYNQTYPGVTVQTGGTGSGTGISDATNGTADIGASDAYLAPSNVTASPGLKNIPLAISSQLVTYNIPGVLTHLKLSGSVLSQIYQGKVTNWNNSAITALNTGVTLPNLPIVTLHRADSSGDTFLFTQFLSKTDPSGWGATVAFNTTVQWPNAPGALGETGNSGMVTGCKATPGCIAYVGISYQTQALQAGLGYASLENAKSQFIAPTAASIAAEAAAFINKTPPNGTISLIYGPAKGGYPIVNYEYAIVETHQASTSKAKAIRSLLEWAINVKDGNAATYLAQVNFQPLPPAIYSGSLKQILTIS